MTKLYVLYDRTCGFCVRCAVWLRRQKQLVPLEVLASGSPRVAELFPGQRIFSDTAPTELLVVGDDGAVYRDTDAWLMAMWALEEYREWAIRLSAPGLRPFARRAFEAISHRRHTISRLLRMKDEGQLARELDKVPEPIICAS